MSRGLRFVFEGAVPALTLAVLILAIGIGYGFYAHQSAPAPEQAVSSATTESAAAQ